MKNFRKIHIVILVTLFSLFTCQDTSTDDLLNLKFSTGGIKGLKITSPSPITVGQPFKITVTATNTVMPNGVQKDYSNTLNLTLQVGGGTLTNVTGSGWNSGVQDFTIIYDNPSLALNATEVILLKATDTTDSATSALSNNITAISQKQFKITVPSVTFKGQAFTATITAVNFDNSTNTAYNGTANLSTYLQIGTVSPASVTGFVNGEATVSLTVSESFTNLQLKAVDSVNSLLTGLSNTFQVYYDSVSLSVFATPALPNSLRLEYTYPTGTNTALIYRDSGSGLQLLATQNSPANFYTDTGLSTQNYTYQVVVQNAPGTVQYSATKTAMPGACGMSVSGAVSGSWTPAGNPYCMTGNTTVSGTLTIAAGTVVLVDPTFSLTIQSGGKLISQGTNTDPVVFTSSNTVPAGGDWKGIIFASGAVGSTIASDNYISGSIIDGTRISFAGPGITTAESLYIANSTIQNNRNNQTEGGGIYANMGAGKQLVIKNSLILNNATIAWWGSSLYGGGVYSSQRTAIYSSRISGNSANVANKSVLSGGGVYIGGSSSLLISNQIVQNNLNETANSCCLSGAGVAMGGDNHTINGNTFRGNSISNSFSVSGGALSIGGSGSMVSNNVFESNSVPAGISNFGGAISVSGNSNTVTLNTFKNNSNYTSDDYQHGRGGAISSGGNIITRNEIQGTYTNTCGGALNFVPSTVFTNNNIYYSTSTSTGLPLNNSNNPCYATAISLVTVGLYDLTANYWGGSVATSAAGLASMGICDILNSPAGCPGTADVTGAVSTPYPLCKTAPLDPNCVGANF